MGSESEGEGREAFSDDPFLRRQAQLEEYELKILSFLKKISATENEAVAVKEHATPAE